MKTREELREELRQIEEIERNELIEKHCPRFKALEGKCFKKRDSYLSSEEKGGYWFIYIKIQKIEKTDLYESYGDVLSRFDGWCFQTDIYGHISIDFNYKGFSDYINCGEEISNEEFAKAWAKLQKRLSTADV